MSPRRLSDKGFKTTERADPTPRAPLTIDEVGDPDAVNRKIGPKIVTARTVPPVVDTNSDLLTVEEAAAYLWVSKSYLDKLRSGGGGPAYHRLGARRVVYHRKDLSDWVRVRRFDHTAQYPER